MVVASSWTGKIFTEYGDFKTPCHSEVVTGMSLNISGVSGSRPAIDLYSIVDCSIGCVVVSCAVLFAWIS